MLINPLDLDLWIENGWNALFVGKHGVGKTSIIKQAFERHNLNWMYFSASTMDPWVDFIGVPKEKGEGEDTYLGLVRPECFYKDEVEALFFDEFNRSHKKVRNAVMELIQFKSINGKKFDNLRIIWAAINPEDEEEDEISVSYQVEPLDPAQKDRFQIQIEIPYKCDKQYFSDKYGESWGSAAVGWWNKLEAVEKDLVSPRRLDYALTVHANGGNLRHVLPPKINTTLLMNKLVIGDMGKFIAKMRGNEAEAKKWLRNRTNFDMARKEMLKTENFDFFVPFFPKEEIANYLVMRDKIGTAFRKRFLRDEFIEAHPEMREIVREVLLAHRTNTDKGFEIIRNTLNKYRDEPKIIPKECVVFRTFLKNLKDDVERKITYIESIGKSETVRPAILYYKSNAQKGTNYKKSFIDNLIQNYTFKQTEEECIMLIDFMFEMLRSFQLSTLKHNTCSYSMAFALIMKSIEKNSFGFALEVFHACLEKLTKSEKEKLRYVLSEAFTVSEFDIDRFIEAKNFL